MNKVCTICYREFPEDQMRGDMCQRCKDLIGKGDGYKSIVSEEEADKWLNDFQERKSQLIKNGKLKK